MKKSGKYQGVQMYLPGAEEWACGSLEITGADVYCTSRSKVRREWLSGCKEERALTQSLMEQIVDPSNLIAALRRVVKNGGSPGVDGMTTRHLSLWFSHHLDSLRENLLAGDYYPSPVREVEMPKSSGGRRKLGIPTVVDRLVQQAIHQVLARRYERIFSANSYGFRPGRKAHDALSEAGDHIASGKSWIVDLDLERYFDTVNHDRLLWLLGTRIGDKVLLVLIGRFLRTGSLVGGLATQRISGTPQGSPLSPLLSNIVLDELDKELEYRGHSFVRYADDLIIMTGSVRSAERVKDSVTFFIEGRMKLKVNEEKSRICRPYELNFLGHSFQRDGGMGLSRQSEQSLKAKLRQVTRRNRGISLAQLVKELNPKLRGWLNYFRHARMGKRLSRLEGWLNRRIRCFRLKQCKRAIGIARFLHKLGVPWNRSWTTAGSSKGWHRLSMSHAVHEGMNNQWVRSIGLFSLTENYSFMFKETAQYERRTLGGVRGRQSWE